MTTFTPGPWKKRKGFDDETIEIYAPNPKVKKPFKPTELATVGADNKEGKANARLIAAAPELLDALESLVCLGVSEEFRCFEEWDEVKFARRVLAKATGGAA